MVFYGYVREIGFMLWLGVTFGVRSGLVLLFGEHSVVLLVEVGWSEEWIVLLFVGLCVQYWLLVD